MTQVERFKWAMLHVAVGDPPWTTGMAWADAVDAFPDVDRVEVDRIVADALLELLDDGHVFFFRFAEFGDEFSDRDPEDGLAREAVAEVLRAGRVASDSGDGREIGLGELLAFRSTPVGELRHAELAEDDYRIFGRER